MELVTEWDYFGLFASISTSTLTSTAAQPTSTAHQKCVTHQQILIIYFVFRLFLCNLLCFWGFFIGTTLARHVHVYLFSFFSLSIFDWMIIKQCQCDTFRWISSNELQVKQKKFVTKKPPHSFSSHIPRKSRLDMFSNHLLISHHIESSAAATAKTDTKNLDPKLEYSDRIEMR